ncbi:hypothetical protein [Burkholderia sp. Ax-1719]|uniref:nSTAND3 domain-containing NTPase n=1 Tax=Burkholderia sp. Ax-1719 TaxID=2608334 RepID=UPI0014225573|nr:hypothetical protein [Burkholderia sp. Ax-1719]NIE63111.1 hypothetical protein [Burkholderia sp. Ax-1719]
MTTQEEVGGANASYRGYDYQKLVTVWVALKLNFGPDARADEIIVEPASHDDVKARLTVQADDADGNITVAGDDELHVQIKFKGAGHWSAKNFAAVVKDKESKGKRGPGQRSRAKTLLLQEPNRRYVFITNTSIDGSLVDGRVASPAERPKPGFVPSNLALNAAQNKVLAGRFALIEQMTLSETDQQIKALLAKHLKVPSQNLDRCVSRLKQLVEDRFLGVPDPLRKVHIEKIAEELGGLPHANPQLAYYSAPASRPEAEKRLARFGAVLLVGPSGYGKSLTAESLVLERRNATPPFKVIREIAGLSGIEQALVEPGPVLFHLEDPWGQSGLNTYDAAQWTSRLSSLILRASAEKQFVITSRSEIYREALGEAPAPVWNDRTVVIDGGAYDQPARLAILHDNLSSAGSWKQDLARQHESRLLRDLQSPQEITAFTRELKAVTAPIDAAIGRLIDRALTDSRKHVVMELVRGFGDQGVRGAAVLWTLLRHSRPLQRERLRSLRRCIDRAGCTELALDDLAEQLAQTQLEIDADDVFYAHSKVAEALENLARTYPRAAETALNAAAKAALELVEKDPDWLDEIQRLVDGSRELRDQGVTLNEDIVQAVDTLLVKGLHDSRGNRFILAWQSASRRLSKNSPISQLVRWLDHGDSHRKRDFDLGWRPPKITSAAREAVLAVDPSLTVLRGFICYVLPFTDKCYRADDLLPWLKEFGTDLSEAFFIAGYEVLHSRHYVVNAEAISECALGWSEPPYDHVWSQILEIDAALNDMQRTSEEQYRQANQGELDFADQLLVHDAVTDESPSPAHYARGYVRARRRLEGYSWIPTHPRPDIILPIWADLMRMSTPKVTSAELDAFFAEAQNDEQLQVVGLRVIGERRLAFGRARVFAALQSGGAKALEAAVDALSWLEGDQKDSNGLPVVEAVLLDLMKDLPATRVAVLAPLIANLESSPEKAKAAAERVVAACNVSVRPVAHLALQRALRPDDATLVEHFRQLGRPEVLKLVMHGPRRLARWLLVVSSVEQVDVTAIAEDWMNSANTDDVETALDAFSRMHSVDRALKIAPALAHSDYSVRRKALQLLAPLANDEQKLGILQLARDKSAPVRASVAEVIGKEQWSDAFDTLFTLLRDTRDFARHPEIQHRSEAQFQVAREAASALAQLQPLPSTVLHGVIEFLNSNTGPEIDVAVHTALLGLLTKPENREIWPALERALKDDHVVGGADENLYPIRYEAAWTVVRRLVAYPDQIDDVPWAAVEGAAIHFDSQLAAPALIAIGLRLMTNCGATTLQALRGENASPARVALALSMIDEREHARGLATRHRLLADDHPLFDDADDISTVGATLARWSLSAAGLKWLEMQATGNDVEAVLLWIMAQRVGLPLGAPDFEPSELRRQSPMPLISLAEMFGME